jgi:hypothetical protein
MNHPFSIRADSAFLAETRLFQPRVCMNLTGSGVMACASKKGGVAGAAQVRLRSMTSAIMTVLSHLMIGATPHRQVSISRRC